MKDVMLESWFFQQLQESKIPIIFPPDLNGDMESDWVVTEGPLQQKTFHCHFTQSVTSVDTESVTKI